MDKIGSIPENLHDLKAHDIQHLGWKSLEDVIIMKMKQSIYFSNWKSNKTLIFPLNNFFD